MSLCEEEEEEEGVGGFHGNQDVFSVSVSVSVCGHWEGVPMTLVSCIPSLRFALSAHCCPARPAVA